MSDCSAMLIEVSLDEMAFRMSEIAERWQVRSDRLLFHLKNLPRSRSRVSLLRVVHCGKNKMFSLGRNRWDQNWVGNMIWECTALFSWCWTPPWRPPAASWSSSARAPPPLSLSPPRVTSSCCSPSGGGSSCTRWRPTSPTSTTPGMEGKGWREGDARQPARLLYFRGLSQIQPHFKERKSEILSRQTYKMGMSRYHC